MLKRRLGLGIFNIFFCVGVAVAQPLIFPLSGNQEVPPVTTDALAACTGTLNALRSEYEIGCNTTGIDVAAAHIHNASAGVNGDIVFFFVAGTTFSASITEESLAEQAIVNQGSIVPLSFADFRTALEAGDLYVNVHSAEFPAGEIRGQIPPPPDSLFFPQFGNGDAVTSDIVLVNLATTGDPVAASVVLLDPQGNPLTLDLEAQSEGGPPSLLGQTEVAIPPLETVTLRTSGEGPLVVGSATVLSSGPLSGTVRFAITGFGVAGVGASPPLTAAVVPVRNEGLIRSAVAIRNTAAFEIAVYLHFWYDAGHLVAWVPIPAGGRIAQFVDEIFPEVAGTEFAGSLTMETDEGSFAAIALEQGSGVLTTLPVSPLGGRNRDIWVTLLHNNDGESQLLNLGSGELEDFGGIARFRTVVDQLREEATEGEAPPHLAADSRCAIVVSSGDNYLAGPEFNVSLEMGVPFFDSIALDLIGYDAIAIGNHEFDFGPDVLEDFIMGFQNTQPPFLSSNLDFAAEPGLQALVDQGRIAGSTVVNACNDRIGIIGATTPNLSFISSPRNVLVMEDVAAAVQAEVADLEAQGVNKIILISHLQDVDEDVDLATRLSGVDIMVAGGGDELLANPDNLLIPGDEAVGPYPIIAIDSDGRRVPVVTTSGSYGYVGRLVAGFDRRGNYLGIHDAMSGPVRVAGGDNPDAVVPDPQVQAAVTDPVAAGVAALEANVVGVSEVALDGVRNQVRSVETNEGNLIADSLLWQAAQLAAAFGEPAPDVALQNGGGIRNDSVIPAGNITELDTFDMVPFSNFVSIVPDIPRSQFKEILENAVSRTVPGDVPGGTGRFAQIGGFSFQWSASGTAQQLNADGTVAVPGTRVQRVELDDGTVIVDGGVVQAGDDVVIATIDFLARGGDEYPYRDAPFTTVGVTYQQALRNYIQMALGGVISAADYPEGGEGRIQQILD